MEHEQAEQKAAARAERWRVALIDAEYFEKMGRLEEAERALLAENDTIFVAMAIADMYQRRMMRLMEEADKPRAEDAYRRSRDWANRFASWATSGGEGAANSEVRDRHIEGLAAALGYTPPEVAGAVPESIPASVRAERSALAIELNSREMVTIEKHLVDVPVWGCVLLAARATLRALRYVDESSMTRARFTRDGLKDACLRAMHCARTGESPGTLNTSVTGEGPISRSGSSGHAACVAAGWVADALSAAAASLDFSAAETACRNSSEKAIRHAVAAGGDAVRGPAIQELALMLHLARTGKLGTYDVIPADVLPQAPA